MRVINGAAGEQATKDDIKGLQGEFKDQFAAKAELRTEVTKLETKIEAATNRVRLGA